MLKRIKEVFEEGTKKPRDNFYAAAQGIYLELKPEMEYPILEERTIDLRLADDWVQPHPTEEGKALARKLLNNIYFLTFGEFQDSLSELAQKVNEQIKGDDYVLLVDPSRSSEYIASDYYPELQSERLKDIKKVVFLDDGAFSGSQVNSYIENHVRPIYHLKGGRQVIIGICYTTPRARDLIEKALPEVSVTIFPKHLPVLEDILTKEELDLQKNG